MAGKTSIEWTATVHADGTRTLGSTWNPIRGCSRVSEGCRNCYAEIMAARFSKPGQWGHGYAEMVGSAKTRDHRWTGKVDLVESQLLLPMKWREPRRIFVNSTSDLFHENLSDEAIDRVFAVMALAPRHTFQILTKRSKRMREYMASRAKSIEHWERAARKIGWTLKFEGMGLTPFPLPNVWLGVSVEDQERADERIPDLLATPAAVRFISAEPLLGPIDLTNLDHTGQQRAAGAHGISALWREAAQIGLRPMLDWVIAGGESGPGARPMHPDWARILRDQCAAASVPFFFKQWGEYASVSEVAGPGKHFSFPDGATVRRVGKGAAGARLDGREHKEFPAALAA